MAAKLEQAVFEGSLLMDEVVFFHRPSRVVLFVERIENLSLEFLRATPGWSGGGPISPSYRASPSLVERRRLNGVASFDDARLGGVTQGNRIGITVLVYLPPLLICPKTDRH